MLLLLARSPRAGPPLEWQLVGARSWKASPVHRLPPHFGGWCLALPCQAMPRERTNPPPRPPRGDGFSLLFAGSVGSGPLTWLPCFITNFVRTIKDIEVFSFSPLACSDNALRIVGAVAGGVGNLIVAPNSTAEPGPGSAKIPSDKCHR